MGDKKRQKKEKILLAFMSFSNFSLIFLIYLCLDDRCLVFFIYLIQGNWGFIFTKMSDVSSS